jgi:SAM-dependent methyltransferase
MTRSVRASFYDAKMARTLFSPFITPRGVLGRLAGSFMLRRNDQEEVLALLDVRPGDTVLEVGFGPGGLLRLLADRTSASMIYGVDTSATMVDVATDTNRDMVDAGRIKLALDSVDSTGLPDSHIDRVISVNNVVFWPDLRAGAAELRRVLRPGGTLVVAWHGGSSPSAHGRIIRMPAARLRQVEDGLREYFPVVERCRTTTYDVFVARGDGGEGGR